jgi:hypothetical protein
MANTVIPAFAVPAPMGHRLAHHIWILHIVDLAIAVDHRLSRIRTHCGGFRLLPGIAYSLPRDYRITRVLQYWARYAAQFWQSFSDCWGSNQSTFLRNSIQRAGCSGNEDDCMEVLEVVDQPTLSWSL